MAEPARPGGFDMNRMSTGQKAILATGILLFIAYFLPWEGAGGELGRLVEQFAEAAGVRSSLNAWQAAPFVGWLAALVLLATLVWEGLVAAGVARSAGNMSPGMLGAIGGGITVLLTIIIFLMSLGGVKWGAFVGLILALALGYASYLRWQEAQVGGTAAPGRPMAPPAP